jgi:hypothetical protein
MSSNDAIKSLLGTSQGQTTAAATNSPSLKNIASNSTHVVSGVARVNSALAALIKSWGG